MTRIESALDWASRGYLIFPLHDPGVDGKRPRIKGWQDRATTDPLQIEAWWEEWPEANIGVALTDRQYVLDADGPEQVRWVKSHLPETLSVGTGRGRHFYFRLPAEVQLRNRTTLWNVPGLEGKTAGKLVAGPGSVHKTGSLYYVRTDLDPGELPWWSWEHIGDRDESVQVEAGDSPTAAELEEWDRRLMAKTEVGVGAVGAMRARGRLAYTQAVTRLRRDLRGADAWATVFYARSMQVGEHVARGGLEFQEVVDGLSRLFDELDDGRGGDKGRDHVMRSIRRGVLAGARGVTHG